MRTGRSLRKTKHEGGVYRAGYNSHGFALRTPPRTPAVVTTPVDGELRLADAAVERHVVGHPERRVDGGG